MKVKTAKCWVLALALAGMGLAGGATQADVITFTGLPNGILAGSFTEGNFTYNTSSGSLFVSTVRGLPAPDMEGGTSGGILRIVRKSGGLFTFDGADVAQLGTAAREVLFRGVLNGTLQSAVNLTTTSVTGDFAGGSQGSGLLSGVSLDELLVELDATFTGSPFIEVVDNIRLTLVNDTGVPEPTTLGLLALGLAGLGWSRRKK